MTSPPRRRSSGGPPTGTVTLFGYEDNFVPEVIDPFLEANPDLDVQTAVFSNNDEAVTKLQNGFQADVINVCTEETRRMVDLGLLQPIDTSRIEAWDTLFPSLKDQDRRRGQDGEVYMMPNLGGTSGIIYNPDEVPQGVDSYRDLFEDPALAGKVTLEDSATTVIAITALALGHEDPVQPDRRGSHRDQGLPDRTQVGDPGAVQGRRRLPEPVSHRRDRRRLRLPRLPGRDDPRGDPGGVRARPRDRSHGCAGSRSRRTRRTRTRPTRR